MSALFLSRVNGVFFSFRQLLRCGMDRSVSFVVVRISPVMGDDRFLICPLSFVSVGWPPSIVLNVGTVAPGLNGYFQRGARRGEAYGVEHRGGGVHEARSQVREKR